MRDRADEALPCNRPSTLRQAQGTQGQGPPFDPSTSSGTAGSGTALNCLVD